jgi:hypothetical protein
MNNTIINKNQVILIFLILISLILQNCYSIYTHFGKLPDDNSVKIIRIRDTNFTLQWQKPLDATPDSYNIYYKAHHDLLWNLLYEVTSDTDYQYTINYFDLDDNLSHDFGITAVYGTTESGIHTSLESSANPNTGWYVEWHF